MHRIVKKSNNDEYFLSFEGEQNIDHIDAIKNALMEALAQKKSVTLSFEGAEVVDISFFQILCSFHKSAEQKGIRFNVSMRIPEFIKQSAVIFGFSRHITCANEKINSCFWLTEHASSGTGNNG